MPDSADHPAGSTDARLTRRGIRLEYATIAWNAVEFLVTIGLGIAAGSLALVAFGLDTLIELFASFVVIWHLRGEILDHRDRSVRALRLIGGAFYMLGAFLVVAALLTLAAGHVPDESPLGIAYLALTATVMLTLALLKRATGRELDCEPLVSGATMSMLDAALAGSVLLALALNWAVGWWWADGLAALAIAGIALREGMENHREAAELAEAGS